MHLKYEIREVDDRQEKNVFQVHHVAQFCRNSALLVAFEIVKFGCITDPPREKSFYLFLQATDLPALVFRKERDLAIYTSEERAA